MDKARKKILFIITKSNYGGAQRYVYDLATSLPKDQFEVAVILGGQGILKEKLEEKNIRVISLPHLKRNINLRNEFLSFKDFFMIFWREKPDIVHGNSSKAGGIAAFIARIIGIRKIIFTAHAWAFNENRNFFSRLLISFLHWFNIVLSTTTIAVSASVKNQVSYFPLVKNKIKVIHLGLNEPEFLSREDAREWLKIRADSNEKLFLTIGELHPSKGFPYVIDALAILKEKSPGTFSKIRYYIMGEGDEKDSIQKAISDKKLEERIILLGYVGDGAKYLKGFDFFILPSITEALGLVLIEAGYAKVPVLASNVGGIPETIEDGLTGKLFPPRDAEAIRSSIEETMREPSSGKIMSDRLYEKVKNQFSLNEMLKKTINVYLDH